MHTFSHFPFHKFTIQILQDKNCDSSLSLIIKSLPTFIWPRVNYQFTYQLMFSCVGDFYITFYGHKTYLVTVVIR